MIYSKYFRMVVGILAFIVAQKTALATGNHKLFVTSTYYSGNLGGLSGADTKCQARASGAGFRGVYKAILSTSTVNAKDRVEFYAPIENTVGQRLADNEADLFDGMLDNAVQRDELGRRPPSPFAVWTGTYENGTRTFYHCDNWTKNSNTRAAYFGMFNYQDWRWMRNWTAGCGAFLRLYCVHQFSPPTANDKAITTDEDKPVDGQLDATDIDGDSLSFSIVSPPSKGDVRLNSASGAFTYIPNRDANGSDSFTFKVNDGVFDSNVATVNVTINPIPDPWIRQLGGSSDDGAFALSVDANGNVFIAGTTYGSFEGEPNKGGRDAFIAKLNPDGTL